MANRSFPENVVMNAGKHEVIINLIRRRRVWAWVLASTIGVVLIPAVLQMGRYAEINDFIEVVRQRMSSFDARIVSAAWEDNENNLAGLKLIYEQEEGRNLADIIVNDGNDAFARYNSDAWDNSMRFLAREYEDAQSVQLALRPYHAHWIEHYIWLIKYLQSIGYSFQDFENLESDLAMGARRKIYMRYDIHSRDVGPLYGIFDVNKTFNIPSVSFLLWDYNAHDRARREDFLMLLRFSNDFNKFGFHASPLASVLSDRQGGYNAYREWRKSGGLRAYLDGILEKGSFAEETADLQKEFPSRFQKRWESYRKNIPGTNLISFHGGEIDYEIKGLCAEHEKYCVFKRWLVDNLYLETMGTRPRDYEIVDFYKVKTVTDSVDLPKVLCGIKSLAKSEESFIFLIHPAQFFRGKRNYKDFESYVLDDAKCPQ